MKYKHILLPVLLAFFATGCIQDDLPENLDKKVSRLVLSANQVPKVTSTLIEKLDLRTPSSNYSIAQVGESALKLDMDNIHQVIDTLGNETYAFRVLVNLPNPKVFYNLVLKYDADGNAGRPFLLRYEMEEAFYMEYLSTGSLENFRGKLRRIYLTNVGFNNPSYSQAPDAALEINDDPGGIEIPGIEGEPCPDEQSVGGGNGDDGDVITPGAGEGCTTYVVTTDYYTVVCDSNGLNCGEPSFLYSTVSIVTECDDMVGPSANTIEICQIEEEEVPVVGPVFKADLWEAGICEKDSFVNNVCVQEIWNKMKDNNVAYNSLSAFLGDDPIAELCFDIKDLNDNTVNGRAELTGSTSNALVTISLNSTQLNRSKLAIARTIIHESIHAELYAMVVEAGGSTVSSFEAYVQNNPDKTEFQLVWSYIEDNLVANSGNASWQHEYMADYYIDAMSAGLSALSDDLLSPTFKRNLTGSVFYLPGEQLAINWDWDDFYGALAWDGLRNTNAWNDSTDYFRDKALFYIQQLNDLETSAYECN